MTTAQRPRIFCVRPRTTNIGNDVIALATDSLLQSVWGEPVEIVSLPSVGAPGSTKGDGLDSRNVYEINRLGDGLLVGGGNLFENGGLHVDPTALDALQVPLALAAVSTGRVYARDGRLTRRTDTMRPELIAALSAHAAPLLVRDDATAALLDSIGVGGAVVGGCPSLFLDRFVAEQPTPDPDMDGSALLSIRNPRLMCIPYGDQEQVRSDVRRIAADLNTQYDRVFLLCHDYQDLAFAAAFPDLDTLYTEDARVLLAWLRACALNVTYRLHAFLPCIAYAARSVHISYDERGETMVETLGAENWNVRMPVADDVPGEVGEIVREAAAGGCPRLDVEAALDRLLPTLTAGLGAFATRVGQHREAADPAVRPG